jgi:hypothetical protein
MRIGVIRRANGEIDVLVACPINFRNSNSERRGIFMSYTTVSNMFGVMGGWSPYLDM